MNIKNEESSSEQYAIISYSHADSAGVRSELDIFEKNSICYWFDERMTGGDDYEALFFRILDNENCKGIIFFISDAFLLSDPCAKEMEYYKDKYGVGNSGKFCLFVLPQNYPFSSADAIYDKVDKYVVEKNDVEIRKKLRHLDGHINLFLELNNNGKMKHAVIGNVGNYISDFCQEGQLFYNAGIIYGSVQISDETFGYFPQEEEQKKYLPSEIEKKAVKRNLDKADAFYLPVEWIVITENEQSQTLLSRKLLYAINYADLKYPLSQTGKTIEELLSGKFLEHFKPDENGKKIKKVRFLSEKEFQGLLIKCGQDTAKKRALLLPEPTFFAQITNRKNMPAFWLAGDINDARRVDAAAESLCGEKAGVELYYVRIVIEVEK